MAASVPQTYAERYSRKPITDIFTADTDFDRRECTRKVPMKVLILGLGRTGTACMSYNHPLPSSGPSFDS